MIDPSTPIPPPRSFDGFIFDMDGVLVDSGPAHKASWQMLGLELGRPISDAEFAASFGRSSRDIIRKLFGADTADAAIQKMDARKEALYRDLVRAAVPVMPGARELLDRLEALGVARAIGSSGPRENIDLVVDALGPRSRFQALVSGFDVAHGKPHPDVFLKAAERLGLPPTRCIVVEDAPAGVEAGRRAGMRVVALTSSHGRAELGAADVIVDHLADLDLSLL